MRAIALLLALTIGTPSGAQEPTQRPPSRAWIAYEAGRNIRWRGATGGLAVAGKRGANVWQYRITGGAADESRIPDGGGWWVLSTEVEWGRDTDHGILSTRWLIGPSVMVLHTSTAPGATTRRTDFPSDRNGVGLSATVGADLVVSRFIWLGASATSNVNTVRSWATINLLAGVGLRR